MPSLYKVLEEWILNQPNERDPFKPNIDGYDIEFICMKAGDLLIWNSSINQKKNIILITGIGMVSKFFGVLKVKRIEIQ